MSYVRLLICEVKKRPPLYKKDVIEYSDRRLKDKLWREVYANVIDKWVELSRELQELKGREVQRRWKNLRTCFKRYLNQSEDENAKKPRKYLYFNQLRFLRTSEMKECNISERDETDDEDECGEMEHDRTRADSREGNLRDRQVQQQEVPTNPEESSFIKQRVKLERPQEILQEKPSPERCKENIYMDMDEDECFLKSLLPTMRRFDDEHKFAAKIEILSAIKKVLASQNAVKSNADSPSHWPPLPTTPLQHSASILNAQTDFKSEIEASSSGLQNGGSCSDANCSPRGGRVGDVCDDSISLDETILTYEEIKCEQMD